MDDVGRSPRSTANQILLQVSGIGGIVRSSRKMKYLVQSGDFWSLGSIFPKCRQDAKRNRPTIGGKCSAPLRRNRKVGPQGPLCFRTCCGSVDRNYMQKDSCISPWRLQAAGKQKSHEVHLSSGEHRFHQNSPHFARFVHDSVAMVMG